MYRQLLPIIFLGDPEKMHKRMLTIVEKLIQFPSFVNFIESQFNQELPILRTTLFDKTINNPVGLAAGFDKDGRIINASFAIGFGFVEIGTVTPNPQLGNTPPRLFRLVEDKAIINNLGFNNQGAAQVSKNFTTGKINFIQEKSKKFSKNFASGMLGINVGKNKVTPIENAKKDYVSAIKTLHPFADYFTLNISSPNTKDLRKLQTKDALRTLLDIVCMSRDKLDQNYSRNTPILLKLSPDLHKDDLNKIISVIKEFPVQGIIATNTTTDRPKLKSKHQKEKGGLSGEPLNKLSTSLIRELFKELGSDLTIIGVGGIFNGADAYEKIRAGASAVQIYTALIYEGPAIVRKVKYELAKLLEKDGFKNVDEAVGKDH